MWRSSPRRTPQHSKKQSQVKDQLHIRDIGSWSNKTEKSLVKLTPTVHLIYLLRHIPANMSFISMDWLVCCFVLAARLYIPLCAHHIRLFQHHTGTGYLRQTIHDIINSISPFSSSMHDYSLYPWVFLNRIDLSSIWIVTDAFAQYIYTQWWQNIIVTCVFDYYHTMN